MNSVFRVTVDGTTFTDPNHAGQTAEQILEDIRVLIDAHPSFTATTSTDPVDPNNIPAIRVLHQDGTQVGILSVFEDDAGVVGAGGVANDIGSGAFRVTIQGVDAVAQNGSIFVDISLSSGPDVHIVVSTSGKTASQVNSDLRSALIGNGFTVDGPANGPFDVTRSSLTFRRVAWLSTDTGVNVSGVGFTWASPPPPPPPVATVIEGSPTLTEWGLVALTVLIIAAALIVLRRKNTVPSA